MRIFVQLDSNKIVKATLETLTPSTAFLTNPDIIEVTGRNDGPWEGKLYTVATNTFAAPVLPAPFVIPNVSRVQAKAILKGLLESPPTGASPWTALQQQQALYLLLLMGVQDLQNGTVY